MPQAQGRAIAAIVMLTAALLLSGCWLLVAIGEFYLVNDTGYALRLRWRDHANTPDGGVHTLLVEDRSTALIATGKLLEADQFPPSLRFEWIEASAGSVG